MFSVYKLKFKIYAAHTNFAGAALEGHYHTFLLTLHFKADMEEYDAVKNLAAAEKRIDRWLEPFRNIDLRETELFQYRDTSIETLGDIFFIELKEYLDSNEDHLDLIRLDISENPVRSYSVVKKPPEYRTAVEKGQEPERKPAMETIQPTAAPAEAIAVDAERNRNSKLAAGEKISKPAADEADIKPTPADENSKPVPQNLHRKRMKLFAAVLFLLTASAAAVHVVQISGVYPRGFDVMYHLYRSSSLLESIQNGDWYPLYDRLLYNGVQVMRYWAPLPVYVLAFCSLAAKGLMNGYLLYMGFVLFLGGCGWLLFGWKHDRILLAAVMGTLWFFIPDNLRVFFGSGNLSRGLIAALLPWLMFFILEFIEDGRIRNVIAVIILTSTMALCHLGETGIIVICLILYFIAYAFFHRDAAGPLKILPAIGISFLLIGIWLYPSMRGGLLSMGEDNLQAMKSSFSDGWKALSPMERFQDIGVMYFGLSLFLICIFGMLLANKRTMPGFLTALIIYFGTTLSLYPFISKIPFGHLFWMERFVTFAMAAVFLSFFLWRELKKWVVVLCCLLIVLDCIPSLGYVFVPEQQRISDPVRTQEEYARETGLSRLKEATNQRTAVMDLSSYGSFAPYYLAGTKPYTYGTFGAAWQSAQTAGNIVQLNTALSSGYYDYLFDRCLELGNDTVLIRTFLLKNGIDDVGHVTAAGERLGYGLSYRDEEILQFSRDIKANFGVKSSYSAIAIGDSAREIALRYPAFKETTDGNLNHYTYEDLKSYETIYLSGFTYDNKETAENLIQKLGEYGTRVYVDMNRAPLDPVTNTVQFLDVKAQEVSFQESYPVLEYRGREYTAYPFYHPLEETQSKWNTVYLTGLKHEIGYSFLENKKISFYGKGSAPNVYYIGFNLPYHVLTRFDKGIAPMVDDIFGMKAGALPERTLIPLQIDYSEDSITIRSGEDRVNTTLAYHDIFRSDEEIYEDNNLLVVDRGITRINLAYPYFLEGVLMTLSGFLLMAVYLAALKRHRRKEEEEEADR